MNKNNTWVFFYYLFRLVTAKNNTENVYDKTGKQEETQQRQKPITKQISPWLRVQENGETQERR